MGIIGKGTNSFKKQDVKEQKSVALGFQKIRFAHKATLGDTGINLASMTTPTEMSSNGFTNPNASAIGRASIQTFRNNLKLVSSLRGLLVDQLSYVVSSNTTITFLGFTAEDGEIFQGWLDEAPTTSLSVVDGKTVVASGILAAGQTDFNIGSPIPLNQNPAQQIGAVMVFADRGLQYRKVGNTASGDGDYIEVPVAGGLGTLLRFNASGSDRFITVMSNGVVSERPDGSMMAFIERVQGQVDAMIPTLAAVAGVPTTTFQAAPNDINLKQFGDTVLAQQAELDNHETRITLLEAPPTEISINIPAFGTGALNTYVDVSSSTLIVPAGTWDLTFEGLVYLTNSVGGVSNVFGNIAILNTANEIVDNAIALFGGSTAAAGQAVIFPVSLTARRVPAGTYRLVMRQNAGGSTSVGTGGADFTGSLTGDDSRNIFYARKLTV